MRLEFVLEFVLNEFSNKKLHKMKLYYNNSLP